jgi:GH25 family lysozyme M1 (1,4-beta-N-acetylmuramidase)
MNLKPNAIYDFSSWEDNIKWDEMTGATQPLAVIMRASIQGAGTRTRFEDVTAVSYVNECKKRGIKTGLYHFLSPNGIAEQAALFLSVWNKCGGADLAPILDVEIDLNASYPLKDSRGKVVGSTIGNLVWQGHVKTYIDLISAGTGRTPIIYTNKKYWAFVMTKNLIGQLVPPIWTSTYPLWIAQYPDNPDIAKAPAELPNGWDEWIMWQYSEKGRSNGFLANDLNIASAAFAVELGGIVVPPPVDPPVVSVYPDSLLVSPVVDGVTLAQVEYVKK